MRDWPTDPVQQHNLLIAALCEDIIAGERGLDGPNVRRVAEINRQINSTRDGGEPNKPLPTDNE